MVRGPLPPDVALSVHLSAIMGRRCFTQDPGPVIEELRAVAGGRDDILLPEVGRWVGFYDDPDRHVLVEGLLAAFPGCEPWITVGRQRRDKPLHDSRGFRSPHDS